MRGMGGWIVVRTILVTDTILLVLIGFMALLWVAAPAGPAVAVGTWLGAGGLLGLLPLTDPYKVQERRRRRYQSSDWDASWKRPSRP